MRAHLLLSSFFALSVASTLAAAQTPSRVSAALASRGSESDSLPDPPYVEPAKEKRGFVLGLATTLIVPGGAWVRGVSASEFGPGQGASLLLGVYVSSHVGLLLGAEGSFDHQGQYGCSQGKSPTGTPCGGFTYGFPALIELAITDRKRGLYFQLGLKAVSSYVAYGDGGTLTATSIADGRVGLGYRWATESFRAVVDSPSWGSLDVYGAVEEGRFSHLAGHSASTDVPATAQDVHRTVEVGVKIHFTP